MVTDNIKMIYSAPAIEVIPIAPMGSQLQNQSQLEGGEKGDEWEWS